MDYTKPSVVGCGNGTTLNFPTGYVTPPDNTRLEAMRLAIGAHPHATSGEIVEAAKVYFAFLTGAEPASGG